MLIEEQKKTAAKLTAQFEDAVKAEAIITCLVNK